MRVIPNNTECELDLDLDSTPSLVAVGTVFDTVVVVRTHPREQPILRGERRAGVRLACTKCITRGKLRKESRLLLNETKRGNNTLN